MDMDPDGASLIEKALVESAAVDQHALRARILPKPPLIAPFDPGFADARKLRRLDPLMQPRRSQERHDARAQRLAETAPGESLSFDEMDGVAKLGHPGRENTTRGPRADDADVRHPPLWAGTRSAPWLRKVADTPRDSNAASRG